VNEEHITDDDLYYTREHGTRVQVAYAQLVENFWKTNCEKLFKEVASWQAKWTTLRAHHLKVTFESEEKINDLQVQSAKRLEGMYEEIHAALQKLADGYIVGSHEQAAVYQAMHAVSLVAIKHNPTVRVEDDV
jgi:hypothetical protein